MDLYTRVSAAVVKQLYLKSVHMHVSYLTSYIASYILRHGCIIVGKADADFSVICAKWEKPISVIMSAVHIHLIIYTVRMSTA